MPHVAPLVDIAFSTLPLAAAPVWTDVTGRVRRQAGIKITRGAADELTTIQPGQCTFTLDNEDGALTPNRAASPYYPNVRKGRRMRVRLVHVDVNHVTNPTFESGVTDWSRIAPTAEPDLYTSTTQAHSGTRSMLVLWGGANLIPANPAFESGVTGWIPHNAASIAAAAGGTSGTGVGRTTSTTTASSSGIKIEPSLTPIAPGEVFQFTFDIFPIAASVTPLVAVQWHDAGGTVVDTSVTTAAVQSAGSWHTVTATASTAVGTAVRARPLISAGVIPVAQAFDVDTVLFQRVAVPATQGAETVIAGLEIGTVYTASAYVWIPTGSPAARLGVAGIGTGSASSTLNGWERITVTWTATAVSHRLQLTPSTAPSAGGLRMWLDDVQVEVGAAATAFNSTAAVVYPRFDGYLNRWPTEWPGGGRMSNVPMTCTDVFKRLNQTAIKSLTEQEILGRDPMAYYTLVEQSESATAGDDSNHLAGNLTVLQVGSGGTLAWSSGTGAPADGLGAPLFTPIDAGNGRMLIGDVGADYETAATANPVVVEAWFDTLIAGRVLLALRSSDAVYSLIMSLDSTTGRLKIQTIQSGVANTTSTWGVDSLADGIAHHVLYNESTARVFVDGVDLGTATVTNITRPRYLSIGGYNFNNVWDGSIAHVALYADAAVHGVDQALAHYTAGATGFATEAANTRVVRLASYAGIPSLQVTSVGTLFGPIASQGAGGRSCLALMQEVETTESAKLFGARDGGLRLQARDVRYAPAVAATLAAADAEGEIKFSDDDQQVTNTYTASRPGGATIRLVNQTSRDEYGEQPKTLSLLKTTDGGVFGATNWALLRYADPLPRIKSVPVEVSTLPLATARALLALDISSALQITGLPAQSPGSGTELVLIDGYTEVIGESTVDLDFFTSPASTDQGWILNDPVYSSLNVTTRLTY